MRSGSCVTRAAVPRSFVRSARHLTISIGLVLSLGGCVGVRGEDCGTVIAKVQVCDPSAAGAPRFVLALQCPGTQPSCVAMDVSTPAGCAAFMGCLYGD